MISVEPVDSRTFRVTVTGRTPTTHTVTLSPEYHRRLSGDRVTAAELVRLSFEFLLEREDNTSILRSFDLPVIGRYFPEYERTLAAAVGQAAGGAGEE
jgi:hypothetical protein